jgi:hypothetical protein
MFNGGLRGKKLYSKRGIRDTRDKTVLDIPAVQVEYVVIAGGGGGGGSPGTRDAGGGGGGGYRSSVIGDSSGGGASAEPYFVFKLYTDYAVTIGAGGSGGIGGGPVAASNGSNSIFHTIISRGGGRGSGSGTFSQPGGSGGGGAGYPGSPSITPGSAGEPNQGYAGGEYGAITVPGTPVYVSGGGGGGAGGAGRNGGAIDPLVPNSIGGSGGLGVGSTILIAPTYVITRGGGGGAGSHSVDQQGIGFNGGGSGGGPVSSGNYTWVGLAGESGVSNFGGGGGGTAAANNGGAGGSGVVNLRYPSNYTLTASAGLTTTTVVRETYKITTISAGTGTVSWS